MTEVAVRKPAVAGTFYPDDPDELRAMVGGMLESAPAVPPDSHVACVIAPHAGFPYSGPTAARAFRRAAASNVERVILLGCSHHFRFDGASIVTRGAFQTPLGDFPIDEGFAATLADRVGNFDIAPHAPEHALEVELPFVAVAIGLVPIVPVLFGSRFGDWHKDFAKTLAELTSETDLVVASSDLSHYLSETQANQIDEHTLNTLLEQNVDDFVAAAENGRCSMCSVAAVATAMTYARLRGATQWAVLDHCTSARASGDTSRVVGYAAVSMEMPA